MKFTPMKYVLALAAMLFWAACSAPEPQDYNIQVFRYNEPQGIQSLDPTDALNLAHLRAGSMIWETLVLPDGSPGLAESWQHSPDFREWTFYLRKNVHFHGDSSAVLYSTDVLASLRRIQEKPRTTWLLTNLESMSAADSFSLNFRLFAPDARFYLKLAAPVTGILSEKQILENPESIAGNPKGTGPFQILRWHQGKRLILKENEHYWGSKPPFQRVAVYFLQDAQTAFLEFLAGRLDVLIGVQPAYRDQFLDSHGELRRDVSGKYEMQRFPFLNTEYLGFLGSESKHPVAKNALLRRAYSHALKREELIRELRGNVGTPAYYGMVPPALLPFKPETEIGYFPDSVAILVKAAGYSSPADLPPLVLYTDPAYADVATAIVGQWRNAEFQAATEVVERATLKSGISGAKFLCFRASWIADFPDASNYFQLFYSPLRTPNGSNYTHFNHAGYDAAFKKMQTDTTDFSMYSMLQILAGEMPVIPLWYDEQVVFYHYGRPQPLLWPNGAWKF